jgi:hypothetical protein
LPSHATLVLSTRFPPGRVEIGQLSTSHRHWRVLETVTARAPKSRRDRVQKIRICAVGDARENRANNCHRDSNSCTSVHTPYPQEWRGPYRCGCADLESCRQLSTRAIHSNTNDLWKTFLLRFDSGFSSMPSPRWFLDAATAPNVRDPAQSLSCISSAAPVPQNPSRARRARHCSRTSPRVSSGMASGPRTRTRTSFDARATRGKRSGSVSRTTRPPLHQKTLIAECWRFVRRMEGGRASPW